jgi:hypothetical protein
VRLISADGRPTRVSIPIPAGLSAQAVSDGAGYLLFSGTGGVYDARPGGLHRITTGSLLAAGPTGWLATDCDDDHRCVTVLIDRASGARRVVHAERSRRFRAPLWAC